MRGLTRADRLCVPGIFIGIVALQVWLVVLVRGPELSDQSRHDTAPGPMIGAARHLGLPEPAMVALRTVLILGQWSYFLIAPLGVAVGVAARRAGGGATATVILCMNGLACAMSVPGIIRIVTSPYFPLGRWGP